MLTKRTLRTLITTLTLALLLGSAALSLAQETTEAAPVAESVQGVGTLFLLIGLGAIGLVSLITLARERGASSDE